MAQSTSGTVGTSTSTSGSTTLGRIIGWLTAGYPDGVPPTDRFALLALLKRRLTDEQVREIVRDLTQDAAPVHRHGYISGADIEELTRRVISEEPSPSDLARVSARLAAAGWPLEGTTARED